MAGWRLQCVVEGCGAQQALPGPRGERPILHRPAEIPKPGPAGGPLPAVPHLHQPKGGEALPNPTVAQAINKLLES